MKDVARYYILGSRHDRWSDPHWFHEDQEYMAWYNAQVACPGYADDLCRCTYARRSLQDNPSPLDAVVLGRNLSFQTILPSAIASAMSEEARKVFEPYLPGAVWGDVLRRAGGRLEHTGYYSYLQPRSEWVDTRRGTTPLAPFFCHHCDSVRFRAADARHEGIIRSYIRGRPLVCSPTGELCIHPDLFEELRIRERFKDVTIPHKIKIYDCDPHGWIVPGEPGWTGTLVPPPGWKFRPNEDNPRFGLYGPWGKDPVLDENGWPILLDELRLRNDSTPSATAPNDHPSGRKQSPESQPE